MVFLPHLLLILTYEKLDSWRDYITAWGGEATHWAY